VGVAVVVGMVAIVGVAAFMGVAVRVCVFRHCGAVLTFFFPVDKYALLL
jgi:hypothetical protein